MAEAGYLLIVLVVAVASIVTATLRVEAAPVHRPVWVVAQFSKMDVSTAFRAMTMATLIQGLIAMAVVYVLSLALL